MSPQAALLIQMALLLALARLLGEWLGRLKQPPVLGELLAGALLGPTVLGWALPEAHAAVFANVGGLESIAQLGLVMLMLLTGLETDVRTMRDLGRAAFTVSLFGLLVPFALGIALGAMLEPPASATRLNLSLFLGVAMAVSAMPVIAKILIDLGLIRRNFAVITLSAAVVDDTVGWIALAVISGLVTAGAFEVSGLLKTLAWLALFLLAARVALYPALRRGLELADRWTRLPGSDLVFVFGATLLCAAATEAIHVHAVFGAFVAGMVLRQCPTLRAENCHKLELITLSLFSPLFFGLVGLEVNLRELKSPGLLAAVCGLALAGKLAGCWLGGLLGRLTGWESLAIGMGMSARGAVGLVVAKIGKDLRILDEELFSAIVVMSILTSFLAPLGLRLLQSRLRPNEEELAREKGSAGRFMPSGALRVLVLAGGGVNAKAGGQLAARLCAAPGDRATVLRVRTGEARWWERLLFWRRAPRRIDEERYFQDLKQAAGAEAARLEFRSVAEQDSVLETVLAEAARGYHFVVVGASGHRHPIHDPFLTQLIRRAPCHVVIVRGEPAREAGGFERALVPTDGSYFGEAAFEWAARYASAGRTRISVLYVTESSPRNPLLPAAALDPAHAHGQDMLRITLQQNYAERLADPARLDCHVRESQSMVEGLVEQVQQGSYDLVVLGAAAKTLTERLSLGSNIEAALETLPCAVAVVIPRMGSESGA
ncbi:MAG: cation:proton antiporter [Planctomycetota bacterium]|nr:cation:proton antiporter [Planctomycetota bacterium]